MVGIALLWAALASLTYNHSLGDHAVGVAVACVGFFSFAAGLALFADGLKYDIVAQLRREHRRHVA